MKNSGATGPAGPGTESSVQEGNSLPGKPSTTLVVLAFAAVYVIWGSTYLAIRFAIESIPPLIMSGSRHVLAGLLLTAGLRCFSPENFSWGSLREWRDAAVVGCLLLLCGNGGVAWAEKSVPSGLAALIVAVVPLWMILFEWMRPKGKRPNAATFGGLVLGFFGVWILVQPGSAGASSARGLPLIVLLLAGMLWAAGSIYSRHAKGRGSPLLAISRQMLCGGSALFVAGFFCGETRDFHWESVSFRSAAALAYLALFGSLIGFTSYVWLMKASTPARVSTYAYVNPAIALLLGWTLGGEAVNTSVLLGASIVLASVIVVLQKSGGTAEKPK